VVRKSIRRDPDGRIVGVDEVRGAEPAVAPPASVQVVPDGDATRAAAERVAAAVRALPDDVRAELGRRGWTVVILSPETWAATAVGDDGRAVSVLVASEAIDLEAHLRHEAAHAVRGHRPGTPEARARLEAEAVALAQEWGAGPA
jgi:hypothetical protein